MPSSSSRKSRARQRGSSIGLVDAKAAVDLATAQTYSENVFLFVPNLIGENGRRFFACQELKRVGRLHANYIGRTIATFHELPSKILHVGVCRIMFAGRGRWTSRASVGPDVKIWRGPGHGD